jgi:hypothetical protein
MSRHPVMRTEALRSIRIPDLMGGLNLRDSVSMVNDNQMTDAVNMWWADGTLRTRLGVTEKNVAKLNVVPIDKLASQNIYKHDCSKETNGEKANLCSVKSVYDLSTTETVIEYDDTGKEIGTTKRTIISIKTVINFFWSYDNREVALAPLEFNEIEEISNYFAVWHNNSLYVFVSNKKIYKYVESVNRWNEIKEDSEDELGGEKIYVPLVAAYCKTNGSVMMPVDEVIASGVQYEGYNLLSNYYRIQYEGFNYEVATGNEGGKSHRMTYFLLDSIAKDKYEGLPLTVKLTRGGSTYEHSVRLIGATNGGIVMEGTVGGDGFKIEVRTNSVTFYDDNDNVAQISENSLSTSIEITAPYIPDNREQELNKIFGMKRTCWYGGSSEGIDGGTRLFLCGNEGEKALVMWSGRNNPLYFPENSYFYVGEESAAVTGFGKQSNLLVIFKNDETWYTQYYRNSEITADQLIDQSVVDYTASSVYFPLSQINSSIGCTYPDTVALCRNRLVWLSRGGKVYTLISENQYNERTIFCVSEMVTGRLKDETATPTAIDWDEHYVLSFGNKFYLMDYNSYGFQYITSYSKTEDSNTKIPWYYWEVPLISNESVLLESSGFKAAFVKNNNICVCDSSVGQNEDVTADGITEKINCNFTTKLFDFDTPSYKKNIQIVNLLVGNNGGDTIKVEFVTERGTELQEFELNDEETNLRSTEYITNKSIFPCIKAVRLFGVKVSSKGLLAVDGMQFNYRMLGGIR